MLHPARRYAEAKTRYEPFDHIVDDDPHTRQSIATLCRTNLIQDSVLSFLGLPSQQRPGIQAARGRHPGGDHHHVETEELAQTSGTITTAPTNETAGSPSASRQ